jgi:hypothetical protein
MSFISLRTVQRIVSRTDVHRADMQTDTSSFPVLSGVERRRTVVALLSASIISLVVWGLVVVLNVH